MTIAAIPVAGRHRRLTVPVNGAYDTVSKARCQGPHSPPWSCPRCRPMTYSLQAAKHRSDR